MIHMPKERIHPKALKAWRIKGLIGLIVLLVVTLGLVIARNHIDIPKFVVWIGLAVSLLHGILNIVIIPQVRMWYWRYEIREDEVDIQSGIIVIKRALIPMVRIQHVDTEQGPILRFFGLATLSISTAGSTHKIPALLYDRAQELRGQIAKLARMSDEDV